LRRCLPVLASELKASCDMTKRTSPTLLVYDVMATELSGVLLMAERSLRSARATSTLRSFHAVKMRSEIL
jgi:hypothetical protein